MKTFFDILEVIGRFTLGYSVINYLYVAEFKELWLRPIFIGIILIWTGIPFIIPMFYKEIEQ
jgi:hypothetical protein